MAAETLLQTFFSRLGFEVDTKGLEKYQATVGEMSKKLLEFTGVASLSVGGLLALTRESTEGLAKVERMSQTYDIATESLAAFNRMGIEFGITSDSMMDSIGHLSVAMGAVASGQGRYLTKILTNLHLSVKDAGGGMKDMRQFLGDVADKMTTMSSAQRNLLITRLGLDPSMVRMLRNGREEFDKLYDSASHGLPFTAEDYKKAEEFEVAFKRAKTQVGFLTTSIGMGLMPAFQKLLERFLAWWKDKGEYVMGRIRYWVSILAGSAARVLEWMGKLTGHTDVLTIAMTALGAAVAIVVGLKVSQWAMEGIEAVKGLVKNVILLITYYKGLATEEGVVAAEAMILNLEIYAIIAAILLLGLAIWLIIDDFLVWQKHGNSVIGHLIERFQNASEMTKKFWMAVLAVAKMVWAGLKWIWQSAADAWSEAWQQIKEAFAAAWPGIKFALITMALVLAAAIVIVLALAGAAIWLLGKLTEVFARVWKLQFASPEEQQADFQKMLNSLLDTLDTWGTKLDDAFSRLFTGIIEEITGLFLYGIAEMISKAADILDKFTFGLSSKLGAKPDDVRKEMEGWAEKHQKGVEGAYDAQKKARADANQATREALAPPPTAPTSGMAPPAFTPEQLAASEARRRAAEAAKKAHDTAAAAARQQAADLAKKTHDTAAAAAARAASDKQSAALLTMPVMASAPSSIVNSTASHSVNAAQTNSNNTDVKATIIVKNPDEAGKAAGSFHEKMAKSRKQNQAQRTVQALPHPI